MPATDLDQIVSLCKRRGFVYQSAEIYGGFRSTYDYGPLGSLLLRNVKEAWVRAMVQQRDDVVLIDAAILSPPQVWEASGHLANFSDPLVDCTNCKQRWRLDKLDDPNVCPNCGATNSFTEAREFNLMFKTQAGPVEGTGADAYLRPETAQGMFTNFGQVLQTTRKKPPFGIAQVGKIVPQRDHARRTGSSAPASSSRWNSSSSCRRPRAPQWYDYWCKARMQWYVDLGIPADMLQLRPHDADELSHYSAGTSDVEFKFPWGFDELEGIAQRTDFDLKAHSSTSGERLDYFDPQTNERYVPYVIEPAAGATRTMAAFLLAAYDEDVVNDETRTVLRLHPRLAPYKVAVLPLSKKDTLTPLAQEIRATLADRYMVDYDETQNIGKRYRRQDEIGTPLVRHGRLRLPRRRRGDRPRSRHDRAGPGADRRAASPRCRAASGSDGLGPSTSASRLPSRAMSNIAVIAKITAQPGKRADVVAGMASMMAHVETEPGTVVYTLLEDQADADVMWVYEEYTDQAALDSHSSSDAMKALGGSIGPFLAGRPETRSSPPIAGGKGL